MRKSILLTALIAVIAVTLALALTQTDKGKNWFSVYTKPRSDVAATVMPATPDATTTAAVAPPAATTPPETAPTTTAAVTPAPTPADTSAPANAGAMTPVDLDAAQARLNDQAPAAGATPAATTPATADAPKTKFKADIAAALQDVSIGSPDAPLTVLDFSSLTCPHCGHFHNEVLPEVKKNYIDTGKVRWVFHGFPLNEPALKAEMVARCAPKDQYVKLIDLMYQNQERWAFDNDGVAKLAMLLKLAGITDDMFLGCVNDKDLQAALLKKIQADGDKYKLKATPTFVINEGEKTIEGAGTYEGFAFDLDALLKAKAAATPKK
jgi:protein-disulfide isomerase